MIGVLLVEDLFDHYRPTQIGVDRYGKPVTSRILLGSLDGRLDQVKSTEGEAFVVDQFKATLWADADVRPGDELEALTSVYQVDGSVAPSVLPGHPAVDHKTAILTFVGPVAS